MKRLLAYLFLVLVLTFSFQPWTNADDINDIQIDGISIGDSALVYFSKSEIKSRTKTTYPGDDKFYKVQFQSKHDTYEKIGFHLKKNDNRFIIHELSGRTIMGFNECSEKKNIVIKEIKEILTNVSVENYKSNYRNKYGKSFSEVTDLKVEKGHIRIYCDDWEEKYTKKNKWHDSFNISISPQKFNNWLNNEAYK